VLNHPETGQWPNRGLSAGNKKGAGKLAGALQINGREGLSRAVRGK
jgi:hypothetical protein